jgi:hypothetical protein
MLPVKKNIKNMQTLDKEIQRLRRDARLLERKFDDNFTYLQENYQSLLMNSIIPEKAAYKSIPASLIQLLLQHERLRKALINLAENLIDKVADGIDLLINKCFPSD